MKFKHLFTSLFVLSLLFSLNSCQDTPNSPTPSREDIYWSRLETQFPDHSSILDMYINNIDGDYHMSLLRRDTNIVDIYVSADGADWSLRETIIPANLDYDFGFNPPINFITDIRLGKDGYIFYKVKVYLFRSKSNFKDFEKLKSEAYNSEEKFNYSFGKINFDSYGTIYSDIDKKSTDNGDTWQTIEPAYNTQFQSFRGMYIDKNTLIHRSGENFYVSEDGGESWSEVSIPHTPPYGDYQYYFDSRQINLTGANPIKIYKPKKGNINVFDVKSYGLTIANIAHEIYNNNERDYHPSGSFNIHTSTDYGKTWNHNFSISGYRKGYYTKSGYFYANSDDERILRNKKPIR